LDVQEEPVLGRYHSKVSAYNRGEKYPSVAKGTASFQIPPAGTTIIF
jgi:hypothetical protein